MEMVKGRTIGIELEGYVESQPYTGVLSRQLSKLGCEIKRDESLYNCYWEDDCSRYGIEVNTSPLNDLNQLREIAKVLEEHNWSTDDRAGTHIHIDISDYTEQDKAKLLRFGKGIERIIFLLVKDYRYGNDFCRNIHSAWRKVFWKKSKISKLMNWDRINDVGLGYFVGDYTIEEEINNYKYSWINILSSQHSTAEFRLFHAMESAEELINQANLAYSIVELVKNSSIEQLEFIIKEIYNASTVEDVLGKFFQALDIEKIMVIHGAKAHEKLKQKLERHVEIEEPQAV